MRPRDLVDLAKASGGALDITGPDPVIVFAIPDDFAAPRGTYLRCGPQAGQTILRRAEIEIVQDGAARRVAVRPEIFLGQSQLVDLRRGGGEIRLHVGRREGSLVPATLVLDPVPPFALLRHAARIANRQTQSNLFRKVRTGLDLLRAEGLKALLARIDAIGHGIGHAKTPLGDPARDYAAWVGLYGAGRTTRAATEPPEIGVLIVGSADEAPEEAEALAGSLAAQGIPEGDIRRLSESDRVAPGHEWVCVTGSEGAFEPAFLAALAPVLAEDAADLLYFDADRTDPKGACTPDFKPGWDEHLAFQQDYLGPLVVRRGFLDLETARGRRDPRNAILALALSATRRGARVRAVEEVLFHHASAEPGFGPVEAAERAGVVAEHLQVLGLEADVSPRPELRTLQVDYTMPKWPSVSAIMPTRDNLSTLPKALASLLGGTDYPDIEIVVVDNGSRRRDVVSFLADAEARDPRVRVVRHDRPFNFSELINVGAARSSGELLLLVNDDVEAIDPGWLKRMASHFARPEAGAVGAKLLFPNGTIQHAGVALGVGGSVAGHIYLGLPADTGLNENRAQLTRRVSAVTAACLLTRRDLFEEIGGLDADHLAVAYNDVDYCLEVGRHGRQVIQEPRAVLIHHESHSRGRDNNPVKRQRLMEETAHFKEKWGDLVFHDPFYSGNHALFSPHFRYAHPPRRRAPAAKR